MQTRHSDRKSPLIATLLRLTAETILPGVLAGFLPAFFAVRRLQADGQPGLVDQIGHAAQMLRLFQLAQVRILFAERCQPLFQPGIVGVDAGSAFSLVEQDLSEKNNYPSKSEEYMANQVFYQIFFG